MAACRWLCPYSAILSAGNMGMIPLWLKMIAQRIIQWSCLLLHNISIGEATLNAMECIAYKLHHSSWWFLCNIEFCWPTRSWWNILDENLKFMTVFTCLLRDKIHVEDWGEVLISNAHLNLLLENPVWLFSVNLPRIPWYMHDLTVCTRLNVIKQHLHYILCHYLMWFVMFFI